MYDYDGCAQFVSDYLTFEPLDPPIDLVGIVYLIIKHYKLYIHVHFTQVLMYQELSLTQTYQRGKESGILRALGSKLTKCNFPALGMSYV